MTLIAAFWIALWAVSAAVATMTASIVVTKVGRVVRQRRTDRLVARVRPLVLAAIYDGATTPVFDDRTSRTAETIATSLLPKLRGDDRDALSSMLEASGLIGRSVDGLDSRSAARRQRSAELLGNAGHVPAERALAARLRDRDPDVRIAAARALGRIGEQRSVDDLFSALAERGIPANTASMAVLRIGTTGASRIVAAIDTDDPLVRSTAVELAGALGVIEARTAIEPLLDDPDPTVRTSAARSLGRLSMPSSVPALIQSLATALEQPVDRADDDFLVGLADALGRIGHRSAIPVLESCFARRRRLSLAASGALSLMGARRPITSSRADATEGRRPTLRPVPSGDVPCVT